MDVSIEAILRELKKHGVNREKVLEVYNAYTIAERIHAGVTRQSGEPYITHPLNVAMNVLKMEVYDPDTISAALLHDTIEDAHFDYEKEHIAISINPTVAELVDGVTKMKNMEFTNKDEKQAANIRKIVNGMTKDIRIIVIKLADRLHNMSTIEWKSPQKQKENAAETLELFVPLAIKIGAYQVKNQLEELSFKYLYPEAYKEISERRETIEQQQRPKLENIASKIQEELNRKGIKNEIVFRTKSINNIYKEIVYEHKKIENIFDLCYFKVLVDTDDECYITLGRVNKLNTPVNERMKDYIGNPRGFYEALHDIILGSDGQFYKIKITTFERDKRNKFGLIADLNNGRSMEDIQKEFKEKWFDMKLQKIDGTFKDDREFVKTIKKELLGEEIYVYGTKGGITIPKGATAFAFVCEFLTAEELNNLTSIIVNDKEVEFDQVLKNNDTVQAVCKGKFRDIDLTTSATTEKAKLMVKKMNNKDTE